MIATPAQMAAALSAAGFTASEIPVGVAIGLAESSGNTDAQHLNSNGTVDRGVWQINSVHNIGGNLFDLQTNANAARQIYLSQGWRAWTTYNTGAYKLSQNADFTIPLIPGTPPLPGLPSVTVPTPSIPGLPDLSSFARVGAVLGNPDFYKRIGVGLAGIVLVMFGVLFMIESNQAVKAVSKMAVEA